ncbi:MAG TPA: hypothetical protein VFW96_09020 [Thermomicrobiales bacterium]|nr:hypothetical protein [Thermomicrobiales bacterium]
MKKLASLAAGVVLALSLLVPGVAFAGGEPAPTTCVDYVASLGGQLPNPSNDKKVTLCHFTGSDSNPFVVNEVSTSAYVSHLSHHGDCYRLFNEDTVCIP